MSTKEHAYDLYETLTESQLERFIIMFSGENQQENEEHRPKAGSMKGILSEYADPDLIPLEKEAWANAAAEKYKNS